MWFAVTNPKPCHFALDRLWTLTMTQPSFNGGILERAKKRIWELAEKRQFWICSENGVPLTSILSVNWNLCPPRSSGLQRSFFGDSIWNLITPCHLPHWTGSWIWTLLTWQGSNSPAPKEVPCTAPIDSCERRTKHVSTWPCHASSFMPCLFPFSSLSLWHSLKHVFF